MYIEDLEKQYEEMSDLEILASGQNGITVVLTRMANENKKRDERLGSLEESDKDKTNRISSLENRLDYIGEPRNSIMYRELRTICCARIIDLLDIVGDGLYKSFWKAYLNKNIHYRLCKHFNVGKSCFIKTKNFEEAKAIARNYTPDNYYLRSVIDRLRKDMVNGTLNLSKDRLLSFKVYLSDSNNGEINLFCL